MRYLLYFTLCALFMPCYESDAQSLQWYQMPDVGLSIPFEIYRFDDVYFISRDTGFTVSEEGNIYKTYDGANYWYKKDHLPDSGYFRSIEFSDNGQYGIAGALSGNIVRSTDRGETWTDISSSISDTGVYYKRICGLAHWENNFYGVGWWGATTARFYKSTDAGQTWQTSYIDTNLASGLVDAVFIAADTGFVTGFHLYDNGTKRESVVLKTTNAGSSWVKVFSDTTIGGRIWKIQLVNDTMLVGSIEPMYADTVAMIKSTNRGNTWNILPVGNKHSTYVGTQGIGFINAMEGWIGGYYNGMFHTTDGGHTWDSTGFGVYLDRFFKVDSVTMYASGATIYKYFSPYSAGVVNQTPQPAYNNPLFPIVPNPSKGKIKIEFDLPSRMNTLIEVVNTDGRTIYHVANGYLDKGHYVYYWDGSEAPNGNYMVWLGTDLAPFERKFVLNK